MLTKLEEQVLMTVWRFEGEGYGVAIFNHLEGMVEKRITMGVVYDILDRLGKRGFLEAHMGETTPVRGGMRKKHYQITSEGVEALVKSREAYSKIMDGFQDLLLQYKQAGHS